MVDDDAHLLGVLPDPVTLACAFSDLAFQRRGEILKFPLRMPALDRGPGPGRHLTDQAQFVRLPVPHPRVADVKYGNGLVLLYHGDVDEGTGMPRDQGIRGACGTGIVPDIADDDEVVQLQVNDGTAEVAQIERAGGRLDARCVPASCDGQQIIDRINRAIPDARDA